MNEADLSKTIETIAKQIAEYPEEIEVSVTEGSTSSIIEVRTHDDDKGKMIGKNGKTAQAIRTIIYASSFKYGKRFNIEFLKKGE